MQPGYTPSSHPYRTYRIRLPRRACPQPYRPRRARSFLACPLCEKPRTERLVDGHFTVVGWASAEGYATSQVAIAKIATYRRNHDERREMRYLVAALGLGLFVVTVLSVLRSLVVPGGLVTRVFQVVDTIVLFAYHLITRMTSRYERKNRILASLPASVLFITLGVWAGSFWVAFALMLYPSIGAWGASFRESGASLLTLGFVSTNRPGSTAVDFLAAFTGLIVVALQIAYLPTLYGAYNRRETEVTVLSARAGRPPWGPEVLRHASLGAGRLS